MGRPICLALTQGVCRQAQGTNCPVHTTVNNQSRPRKRSCKQPKLARLHAKALLQRRVRYKRNPRGGRRSYEFYNNRKQSVASSWPLASPCVWEAIKTCCDRLILLGEKATPSELRTPRNKHTHRVLAAYTRHKLFGTRNSAT